MRRLAILAVAALLPAVAVAHGRASGPAQMPVGLLAVGDFGVGGAREQALGDAIGRFQARSSADALVTLGDNDYTASPARFRENWLDAFGWLESAGVRVAGTLGNHDVRVDRGRYQFGLLSMPGPFYRLRIRDVELFVLDSNAPTRRQTDWLARALGASRARWKIAVMHHPPYTCGKYRSQPVVARRWVPLFERYRVRLVLAAHDHNYQRFVPRHGVTYVVHGGGSGYFYALTRCPRGYPRRVRARTEQGFLYLLAAADRLDGYSVDIDGRRTDTFTLRP